MQQCRLGCRAPIVDSANEAVILGSRFEYVFRYAAEYESATFGLDSTQ